MINDPDMWIRRYGAFEPIVPTELFFTAQGIIRARARRYTDDELIERLKDLFKSRGMLTSLIIDEAEGMPSSSVYAFRFGGLLRAYQKVGFSPDRDYRHLEVNRLLRRLHPDIVAQIEQDIVKAGGRVCRDTATDLLQLNEEFSISLVLARCQTLSSGRHRWKVRFDTSLLPDITIAARLDTENRAPLDYFLLPRLDFNRQLLNLADCNAVEFDSYRFDSLCYLYGMTERYRPRRAA